MSSCEIKDTNDKGKSNLTDTQIVNHDANIFQIITSFPYMQHMISKVETNYTLIEESCHIWETNLTLTVFLQAVLFFDFTSWCVGNYLAEKSVVFYFDDLK